MKLREGALRKATKYIGVTENPPGSNRGRLIDRWNRDACGLVGVFWCASFVHGMFHEVGYNLFGGASVAAIKEGCRKRDWLVSRPRRGDLAFYEFEGAVDFGDHIGIVERVLAVRWSNGRFTGFIQTIEGNTSSGTTGSQSNGGGVFRRRRWIHNAEARFGRVLGRVEL